MRPALALLTQEEHAHMLKLGMMAGFARNGILPSQGPALLEKHAETLVGDVLNEALKFSVIAGIPIGAAWHILGRAANSDDVVEREKKLRIKYYADVGNNLKSLSAPAPQQLPVVV